MPSVVPVLSPHLLDFILSRGIITNVSLHPKLIIFLLNYTAVFAWDPSRAVSPSLLI